MFSPISNDKCSPSSVRRVRHVGGASLTRSHDYRSRRGHGERSRISTRLSSCNSQEFIIGKGSREERERTVPSRPPNIEFQCGGSPTNLSVGVIDVGRVGQGLIHVVRQSAGLVKQYSGAYGSISDSVLTRPAEQCSAVRRGVSAIHQHWR